MKYPDFMPELTNSNLIWNRAAMNGGGPVPRQGDISLTTLLKFHSLAMSSGVFSALENLSWGEIQQAAEGFDWFGLDNVASFLNSALSRMELATTDVDSANLELLFDNEYHQLIPQDQTIVSAYEALLRADPAEFAPMP
jgi:hypothetical protein